MWQRRALETTDGHDQTEYNRILKGLYLPGKPGKAFQDMAPWPYLPTVIDTGKEGDERRPTQPDKDLRRVRNGQLGIHPELTSKAWDTFNSNKARGIRNAYWMWHGQIKVRPERSPHRRNHVFDDPRPPCTTVWPARYPERKVHGCSGYMHEPSTSQAAPAAPS